MLWIESRIPKARRSHNHSVVSGSSLPCELRYLKKEIDVTLVLCLPCHIRSKSLLTSLYLNLDFSPRTVHPRISFKLSTKLVLIFFSPRPPPFLFPFLRGFPLVFGGLYIQGRIHLKRFRVLIPVDIENWIRRNDGREARPARLKIGISPPDAFPKRR